MTPLDEYPARLLELLQSFGRWQEPRENTRLNDDDSKLIQQLAEDRLPVGSDPHIRAVDLVARSRIARELWTSFIQMQGDLEVHEFDAMQNSLEAFVASIARPRSDMYSTTSSPETIGTAQHANDASYSAQVADLVARLRSKSRGVSQLGAAIERYAAQTLFGAAGRGKYVTVDMVMSLVFPSMDTQAAPIGFLITCPREVVRAKYLGKRFNVLFVEPDLQSDGNLAHRVRTVGPFDPSGEIEERFEGGLQVECCIVPVWIDILDE